MNYIIKQIEQRIDFLQSIADKSALKLHYQARFEFLLIYFLAYLWNKNVTDLDYTDKEYVFSKILKPTIGDLVSICRKLDVNKEIFINGKLNKAIEKYPNVRNELLGHGFVYEDAPDILLNVLQQIPM